MVYNRGDGSESSVGGFGGAIDGRGPITVTNCTLSGNSAVAGGGIDSAGALSLVQCTITGNSVTSVTNVDYRGQESNSGGTGGAIDCDGPTTVTDCTLSGNSAVTGGGIDNHDGTLTLANSIIAGNVRTGPHPAADDIFLDMSNRTPTIDPASAYDLIGTDSSKTLLNGKNHNRVGVTPAQVKLSPLANNGGPTQTMALLPGSIAIDSGSNGLAVGPDGKALTTDQRGNSRIINGRVDIGAFEVQRPGTVSGRVFLDGNANGRHDPGEPGLKGWTVFADLNRDGKLSPGEPMVATDSNGNYTISGLPAGKYFIRLRPPAGYRQTLPPGGVPNDPLVLVGQTTSGVDFGETPIVLRSLLAADVSRT